LGLLWRCLDGKCEVGSDHLPSETLLSTWAPTLGVEEIHRLCRVAKMPPEGLRVNLWKFPKLS
jgi:hypothetical protein